MPFLKKLFWVYFLLLIFEGALRKWILPQFSAPLLLVRDPIALLIIWEAYRTHKWPKQWSAVTAILTVSMLALGTVQMVVGENSWVIELYGLRSYLLPFPVAFIMGDNLDEEDLRKFGVWTLWLLLPVVGLEVAQYLAPVGSILNKGAYEGLAQIGYAGGHLRASSTFSFVTGPANFVPMAAAFIFHGLVSDKFAKKWLLWAASFAVVLSIPVTGSRGMIVGLLAVVACVAIAAFFGVSQLATSLKVIVALMIVVALAAQLPVFGEAMSTLQERLSGASVSEGGTEGTFVSRVSSPVFAAIESGVAFDHWYGNGLGMGSNVASTLLTGTQQFLAGEGEAGRVIFEFGGPCGLAFMLFRLSLALMIIAKALGRVRKHQPLAWFLVPLTFSLLAVNVLEQPTIQGFMVITVAFSLAAMKPAQVPSESVRVTDPPTGRSGIGPAPFRRHPNIRMPRGKAVS